MSEQTIINQPNLRIERETGREGPQYDPYHYDEWTFERNGHKLTYHCGLMEWLELDGNRSEGPFVSTTVDTIFNRVTNHSFVEWLNYLKRLEAARWRRHRGHDIVDQSGYPGEHFTYCQTCDEMLDSHFDRSAVE